MILEGGIVVGKNVKTEDKSVSLFSALIVLLILWVKQLTKNVGSTLSSKIINWRLQPSGRGTAISISRMTRKPRYLASYHSSILPTVAFAGILFINFKTEMIDLYLGSLLYVVGEMTTRVMFLLSVFCSKIVLILLS